MLVSEVVINVVEGEGFISEHTFAVAARLAMGGVSRSAAPLLAPLVGCLATLCRFRRGRRFRLTSSPTSELRGDPAHHIDHCGQ